MAGQIKGKQIKNQTITISGNTGNVIVTGDLNMNDYNVLVSAIPTNNNHLVNKYYVDNIGGTSNSALSLLTLQLSAETIQRLSGDTILNNLIKSNEINFYCENFYAPISGLTNNVIITNSAFSFSSGAVIFNSIDIYMNGWRCTFGTTQGDVAFYANINNSMTTLYYDALYTNISLETDDLITIRYSTKG